MKYFLIAGEASGDLHASNLMRELRNVDSQAEFCFFGGDFMAAQGGRLVKHYRDMAFMGFWAVIKNAPTVLRNINECKKAIINFLPDVVILVDYPGFNLRIAEFVKENLKTPVFYYISPKIWAWKEYRIKDIKRYVDRIYSIFPFETEFYAKHNYAVQYVGNPTVDTILTRPNQDQTFEEFCNQNNLKKQPIIAILAGSRKQEISACLPRMIDAAQVFDNYQTVISGAPGIDPKYYQNVLDGKKIPVVFGKTYELLQQSRAAIVNSGTATLETAIIGTPQVVVYHVIFGKLASWLRKFIIKIPFISLVNLVADREVVKELVAHHFTIENVAIELEKLIYHQTYRNRIKEGYETILQTLGEPGAAKRVAGLIIRDLSAIQRH